MRTFLLERVVRRPNLGAAGSAVFRLLGLAARFVLTVYIAHFLGYRAMSSYGFVTAGSAGLVAFSGLGLDYRIARDAISKRGIPAIARVRDRIVLRCLAITVIFGISAVIIWMSGANSDSSSLPAIIILILECVLFDVHQALIARRRPLSANFVLFLRSAAWIPFIISLGIFMPATRTIGFVFWGWSVGLVAAITVATLFCVRTDLLRHLAKTPVDWDWIARAATSAPIVFVSEIGSFGQIYSDRFIIAFIIGREASGLYVFLWSITNSLVPIIQAAILHRITPILVLFWRKSDLPQWHEAIGKSARDISVWGAGWCTVFLGGAAILTFIGHRMAPTELGLLTLMAVATVVRLRGDLLHHALYSTHSDSDWIAINLLGLILAPPMSAIMVAIFGLSGGGLGMLALAGILFAMRRKLLRLVVRDKVTAAESTARLAIPSIAQLANNRNLRPAWETPMRSKAM